MSPFKLLYIFYLQYSNLFVNIYKLPVCKKFQKKKMFFKNLIFAFITKLFQTNTPFCIYFKSIY